MADGFTLEIDAELAESLEKRAAECGLSREAFARIVLEQQVFSYDDFTWVNGDPRARSEPESSIGEEGTPWEELEPRLWERLRARLADKRA